MEILAMIIGRTLRFFMVRYEDGLAFIFGNVSAILIAIQIDVFASLVKALGIFTFGAIGGIGGVIGKRVIIWMELKMKKYYKHFTRKRGI